MLLLSAGPARAGTEPGFSPWSRNAHSAARLVALGPARPGAAERDAAIEIQLDPGFLTYWRQPGDAGLPPTITTTASQNVASVAVDFPAPGVFDEAGAQLFGYQGAVVLPLRVVLADPARPATLAVDLDYAVCAAICLPGKAALRLPLPGASAPAATSLIAAARDAVPRPSHLGADGSPAIEAVRVERGEAGQPGLRVTARGAAPARLFVEGPEGWFFVAGEPASAAPGVLSFPVAVTDQPRAGGPAQLALRLTLVAADGAVDTSAEVPSPVPVDAPAPKR